MHPSLRLLVDDSVSCIRVVLSLSVCDWQMHWWASHSFLLSNCYMVLRYENELYGWPAHWAALISVSVALS